MKRLILTARTLAELPSAQLAWLLYERSGVAGAKPRQHKARLAWTANVVYDAILAHGRDHVDRDQLELNASLLEQGMVLECGRTLALPPSWADPGSSRLMTFHLQYHSFLPKLAKLAVLSNSNTLAQLVEVTMQRWISESAGGLADSWHPYVISTRTLNWLETIAWAKECLPAATISRVHDSLHSQLQWLARRLERGISGNHLLRNRVALAIGSMLFENSRDSLPHAVRRLSHEAERQCLPDGVHFERCPMYHGQVVHDLATVLWLLRITRAAPYDALEQIVRRMSAALWHLSLDDGHWVPRGDSAAGMGPTPREVVARLWLAGIEPTLEKPREWRLADGGFHGARRAATEVRVYAGPIGPKEQPGHGHCDGLAFTLAIDGEQVVIDSGVAGYAGHDLRGFVRSTRAHATVQVGSREQSEVWDSFRVARRAKVDGESSVGAAGEWCFSGCAVPYHSREVKHKRTIKLSSDGVLLVRDTVAGRVSGRVQSYLPLAASIEVARRGNRIDLLVGGRELACVVPHGGCSFRVLESAGGDEAVAWHCPSFGTALPARTLELQPDDPTSEFGVDIEPAVK